MRWRSGVAAGTAGWHASSVRLDGVAYRYRRNEPWVLDGVDVAVSGGEAVVVLGRNGAGKSTLLQLLAGVLRPGHGRITDRPDRIGWVPERFPTDPPFTVAAYLIAVGKLRGLREPEAAKATGNWIDRLGLGSFRRSMLADLSKGTAQKVGLAQALIVTPDLLVLDELWEGLDAGARELVPEIVGEVLAAGGAVVLSDHRGETAWLPTTARWRVADNRVTVEAEAGADAECVIEVAVSAAAAPAAIALLRAAGHDNLRVRPAAAPR